MKPSVIRKALKCGQGDRERKQEGYNVRRTQSDNPGFENGGKGSGARENGINCTLQGNDPPLKPPRSNKVLIQSSIRKSCSQK